MNRLAAILLISTALFAQLPKGNSLSKFSSLKNPKAAPASALIAAYDFLTPGTGTTSITDIFAGINGTLVASPTWTVSGMTFNGTTQWIQMPDLVLEEFTVIVIFNPASAVSSQNVFGCDTFAAAPRYSILLRANGQTDYTIAAIGPAPVNTTSGVTAGSWWFRGFAHENTTFTVYGINENGAFSTPATVPQLFADFTCPFARLGVHESAGAGALEPFNGQIAYAWIFKRALSSTELAQMYQYAKNVLMPRRGLTLQ